MMQNLIVLIEPPVRAYRVSPMGGNMCLNRFCIDEDAAFELSGVNYFKNSQGLNYFIRQRKGIIIKQYTVYITFSIFVA